MQQCECNTPTIISRTFTDVSECIDFIVPYILCNDSVSVYLIKLTTSKNIVVSDMRNFWYLLRPNSCCANSLTLSALEFINGPEYNTIIINKESGAVTSYNHGLGTVSEIEMRVTIQIGGAREREIGGEYELRPLSDRLD